MTSRRMEVSAARRLWWAHLSEGTILHAPVKFSMPPSTATVLKLCPPITGSLFAFHVCFGAAKSSITILRVSNRGVVGEEGCDGKRKHAHVLASGEKAQATVAKVASMAEERFLRQTAATPPTTFDKKAPTTKARRCELPACDGDDGEW